MSPRMRRRRLGSQKRRGWSRGSSVNKMARSGRRMNSLIGFGLTGCSAVICDHRLSQTQFALFTGAEFMSRLYQESIPGILLSTFSAIDADTSIRLYRATIPSVINREALDPDQIRQGLRHCKAELEGHIAPERQPRRTLVRVLNVSTDSDTPVVDAILHSWSANSAIRFPLTAIDDQKITGRPNRKLPRRAAAVC